MEPKKGKRMVSKGEWMQAQLRRARTSLTGSVCILVAIFCSVAAVALAASTGYRLCFPNGCFSDRWCMLEQFVFQDRGKRQPDALIGTLLGNSISIGTLVGVAYLHGAWGYERIKQAGMIDPGVPLTRANTADLPAPKSLLRASEEPVQAQEAVLLRAATEGQGRHEEQLVRASGGTE